MLSRVCTSCVRSARQLVRPAAIPAARPAPRAFSAAAPLFKKAHKQVQEEFDDDFAEDEFDDIEEDLPSSSPSPSGSSGAQSREARYAQAVTDVQAALRRASRHDGRSRTPSPKVLDHLVRTSTPSQLPEVLALVAKWRAANLPAVPDHVAALLVTRLVEADDGQAAVEVLLNRDLYGVDVPEDLKALYPVFAKVSHPQAAAAAAEETPAEGDAAVEAPTAQAQGQGAYRFLSSKPADLAFALQGLATHYAPASAPSDALVGLSTLAAARRTGERSSPRVDALVQRVVKLGEDELVRQAREMPRRWRDIVRMRARVVAEVMRDEGHAEVEWFAHLAESLHAVAKK